ncbi:serine/threonine-protein kinase [Agromyces aerolatus]|uniref:serine/threonine-protein kinase n=1 Tax=Agromyces sp. LY-1074 TaxID=3074080 RepID=UPI00285E7E68|nr:MULTISPECIES: serine/threonine-protein kinase [unclassified Agromyces]MDR5700008.1 serine/threonine-protein kinase [Agromyces sp. LY-1074]MDR5706180.1 serine/threonine-protein kinase [Agromyces sp. LY-1358]
MRRAAADPPELPGYRYVSLLGSGGFADVFLYEQKLPRRRVAVKVLLADDLTRDTRAQFVAEANLMAQLSAHPYIVTIFHADVAEDGRPYFVMEYCSGPNLAAQVKRSPLGVEDALRIGIRIAGAVATAHAAGILHRDIKPANVLTNDYGWPALSDFGISSTLEGDLPVHTMTAGQEDAATGTGQSAIGMSVPWSAPELFDDDPSADTRSDVFSLAATVHTLLAGRSPFEIPGRSNGSLDLIGRIERGAITAIGRADVPRSLQDVLRTGMAVRPGDRYQSAVEFARALQRIELELGYSATSIEVPNLAPGPVAPERGSEASADADETRARSVQTIQAQPGDDETRARAPQHIEAQRAPDDAVDDRTVVRSGASAAHSPAAAAPGATDEHTVLRPARRPDASASPAPRARGSRAGVVVASVAGAIVVAAVGIAIAVAVTSPPRAVEAEPSRAATGEDAVVAATVPQPEVGEGIVSSDGTNVTASFAVSHEPAEEGDRYRWQRADGSGEPAVTDGDEIVVSLDTPAQVLCIDVQVQRGSKTSETVRGCTT